MFESREAIVEFLEHQIEGVLDDALHDLEEEHLKLVAELVSATLEKERAGFDRFFESVSQTLKYIPNFIVLAITNKYIDPPIAARITSKLPIKNAVSIAKGLSTAYICETAIYMDDEYAAELLARLSKSQASQVLGSLYDSHPLKALDILHYASRPLCLLARPPEDILNHDGSGLSATRLTSLLKIQNLFN